MSLCFQWRWGDVVHRARRRRRGGGRVRRPAGHGAQVGELAFAMVEPAIERPARGAQRDPQRHAADQERDEDQHRQLGVRSEEHTSELQSLMRISYAVFCLKKKKEIDVETALNT